jgi:S-formylglutathione hydrolase FrmB
MRDSSPLHMDLPPSGLLPDLLFDCGVSDAFIEQNRAFHQRLVELGIAHEYAEHPGEHSWTYWQEHIGSHLAFHYRNMSGR